jgi:hypothetical protein
MQSAFENVLCIWFPPPNPQSSRLRVRDSIILIMQQNLFKAEPVLNENLSLSENISDVQNVEWKLMYNYI